MQNKYQKSLVFCSRYVQFGYVDVEPEHKIAPGQLIARGTARLLASHGFAPVEEFVPHRGLRVDVMAVGPKSEIWIVECKSSRSDFQTDAKWKGYLEWCDRYFWAVGPEFPSEILPDDTGLIIADAYGGEILRMAPSQPLAAARRRTVLHSFAQTAAHRLQRLRDPEMTTFA